MVFPAVGVTTGVTAFGVDAGVNCDGGGMVALYGKALFGISGSEFGMSGRFGTTSKDFWRVSARSIAFKARVLRKVFKILATLSTLRKTAN